MKILVIMTGGTIGSAVKDGWITNDVAAKSKLFGKVANSSIEFTVSTPYTILSENLSANELNLLQDEIIRNIKSGYDGLIVTHGTDTLLYSAVAAEYAANTADIPVLFVSSDYPLEDARANGYANFEAAVAFIKEKAGTGVFVAYKNTCDKHTNIHIPSHILKHNELNADIHSTHNIPYAVFSSGVITKSDKSIANSNVHGKVHYLDNSGILVIDSHPGDNFSYSLKGTRAVIFMPYHSATLNTANKNFQMFCEKAKEKQIPLFTLSRNADTAYETTKIYSELGIHALPYGTFVSAYMKIWAAISLKENIFDFINK